MAKAKRYTMNRKTYQRLRKMDHATMEEWVQSVYESGFNDGKAAVSGPTTEEVMAALSEIKGIGEKRLEQINDAIEALFQKKQEESQNG